MKAVSTGTQGALEVLPFSLRLLAAIFVCTSLLSAAFVQGNSSVHESQRSAQVRALNNSVLQLHGQLQENASAAGVSAQAAIMLAQRAAALQTLIQEDPHAALTFAFSPELLADLAAKFPDSAAQLESQVTLKGKLEVWTFDAAGLKSSHTEYRINAGGQSVRLHFATAPAINSPNDMLEISGVRLGSEMAVSGSSRTPAGSSAVPFEFPNFTSNLIGLVTVFAGFLIFAICKSVLHSSKLLARGIAAGLLVFSVTFSNPELTNAQGASCSTTGVQNSAVILVTFPGVTLPANVSTQSVSDLFFNSSTGPSLDGFLRDASAGQTSATGAVFGPFTLTGTYSACSDVSGAVLNDAIAAATAGGANLSNYSRVFLVFPDVFACGWAGFGSNSCSITSSSGNFNASVGYLVAAYVGNRASAVSLASHELGHNFGLLHSGTVTSGTQVLGPLSTPGTWTDMGDYWSSMGEVVLGTYPATQRSEVLGWMKSGTNYVTVQSSGTYTLQPLETASAGLQVLKVQRGAGNNAWLWIEYRQPIDSYDATLISQPFSGALIHYEDPNTGSAHSYLPNFTPSDTSGNSPALAAGQTWTDSYSNVSISVLSATSTGLSVSVNYSGAPTCSQAAPTVVASPLNPSIYAGQTANYSVSITNNDSSSCAASAISLNSSEPSGWSTNFSSQTVTLNPGQSARLTMGKGSPNGTPTGTYTVNLTAANSVASAADTANATVMTAPLLVVTLSESTSAVAPPGTLSMSASVTNGGAPVSGASVSFKITPPTGNGSTLNASTNASGVAVVTYKVSQKSPAGTYSAIAQATVGSGGRHSSNTQVSNSSPITFSVQ